MNPVFVLWPMAAAVVLTLGGIHGLVWFRDRKAWTNFVFAIMTIAVAAVAGMELVLMHTADTEQFGLIIRWAHVPLLFLVAGIALFVRLRLGTGRWWLMGAAVGIRAFSLVVNFVKPPNVNYDAITALKQVDLLGAKAWVVAQGVQSPWSRVEELSSMFLLGFVADASVALWRKGGAEARGRALTVGGSVAFFIVVAAGVSMLIHAGVLHIPYLISLPFLAIIVVMGVELSRDTLRVPRMADELRENAESITLAASAAQLALWRWDIAENAIWVSTDGCSLYGIPQGHAVRFEDFLVALHPDDREATQRAIQQALDGGQDYAAEYRIASPNEAMRWISARGKVEFNAQQQPLRMRGVSMDITERKSAELEAAQSRQDLAHLTRVTTLGELSGSLAHELNQPLAIILSNAQAAQRLLALPSPDVTEVREILSDIVAENRRAGEVIQRLRTLLKRGETVFASMSLNEAIEEVLRLAQSDLLSREISLVRDFGSELPPIRGDRVQLQQVVLNLVLNGADAMTGNDSGPRALHVATTKYDGRVRLSVRDHGTGLPDDAEKLFAPFYTTKAHGLGLGLAICRSIADAHEGRLWAEAAPERGAVFHLDLPAGPARSR